MLKLQRGVVTCNRWEKPAAVYIYGRKAVVSYICHQQVKNTPATWIGQLPECTIWCLHAVTLLWCWYYCEPAKLNYSLVLMFLVASIKLVNQVTIYFLLSSGSKRKNPCNHSCRVRVIKSWPLVRYGSSCFVESETFSISIVQPVCSDSHFSWLKHLSVYHMVFNVNTQCSGFIRWNTKNHQTLKNTTVANTFWCESW